MEENKEIIPRIGTFFLVIGIGLVMLFLFSDMAGKITFNYFLAGVICLALGTLFRRRAEPRPSADRFSALKKMRAKRREKKH